MAFINGNEVLFSANIISTEAEDELKRKFYYGDASIMPSDESLFEFAFDNETMTAHLVDADDGELSEIVMPYECTKNKKTYTVISIINNAFRDTSIRTVRIPESVTTIRTSAFERCRKLEVIYLPASVTSIHKKAFYDISNLSDVFYNGTKEMWESVSIDDDNDALINATIHYNEYYNDGYNDGYSDGDNDGYNNGYDDGYNSGYNHGEEAGRTEEQSAFWDSFQNYGQREQYRTAFFQWRHEYIRPKYKITPSKYIVDSMFESCEKLKIIEKDYFDFSNFTPINNTASGCWLLTFSNCKSIEIFNDLGMQAGGYANTWRFCQKLHTIEVMRCCLAGAYSSPFHYCTSLKNIKIEGEIGKSFPIPHSPLTCESMQSIITNLYDYSGSSYEFNFTVTFNADAFAKLEAEGATAIYNGVACTWAELIDNKKWNLTLLNE